MKPKSKSMSKVISKSSKDQKKPVIKEAPIPVDQEETKGKRNRSKSVQKVAPKSKSKIKK